MCVNINAVRARVAARYKNSVGKQFNPNGDNGKYIKNKINIHEKAREGQRKVEYSKNFFNELALSPNNKVPFDPGPVPVNSSETAGPIEQAAAASQEKLEIVLVDSGMGGAMTAGLLPGLVTQLAHMLCLPIGEKPEMQAAVFAGAMVLEALVVDFKRLVDGVGTGPADHVIVACNSASVRKNEFIPLLETLCEAVANGAYEQELNPEIRSNIIKLHEKIQSEPGYLDSRVHEIVTPTAKVGIDEAAKILERDSCAFVRVDSTNGTVDSHAYPDRMKNAIKERFQVENVTAESYEQTLKLDTKEKMIATKFEASDKDKVKDYLEFKVSHTVYKLDANGEQKTIVVENRGNPAWVPDIELGRVEDSGPELVKDSQLVSEYASARANEYFSEIGVDLSADIRGKLVSNTPEISMLCCTHYPAMKEYLSAAYGDDVKFINQATVVRDIVEDIDPNAVDPENGGTQVAMHIGNMNPGGTSAKIRNSEVDLERNADIVRRVITRTQEDARKAGDNRVPASNSVKAFAHGEAGEPEDVNPKDISRLDAKGVVQQQGEVIVKLLGMLIGDRILLEQGYEYNDKGDLEYTGEKVGPKLDKNPDAEERFEKASSKWSETISEFGTVMASGEDRGIDKIAARNHQGRQITAVIAHLDAFFERNKGKSLDQRERIGITTGFAVVDNVTGKRIEGENDGPPGAVSMARTLLSKGLPVTFLIDKSNEAVLVSALVGAGLATLKEESAGTAPNRRTVEDIDIIPEYANGELAFEVTDFDNRDMDPENYTEELKQAARESVVRAAENLKKSNVTTILSIERPGASEYHDTMVSMRGTSVEAANLDFRIVFSDEYFFTIAIGDGMNEMGLGAFAKAAALGRYSNMARFINRGDVVASKEALAADVVLLSSDSNSGGVGVAMAAAAARWGMFSSDEELTNEQEEGLKQELYSIISSYNNTIQHMVDDELSIDGVNKANLRTVDGRRLGTMQEALDRFLETGGKPPLNVGPNYSVKDKDGNILREDNFEGAPEDTSHNDKFLILLNRLVRISPDDYKYFDGRV